MKNSPSELAHLLSFIVFNAACILLVLGALTIPTSQLPLSVDSRLLIVLIVTSVWAGLLPFLIERYESAKNRPELNVSLIETTEDTPETEYRIQLLDVVNLGKQPVYDCYASVLGGKSFPPFVLLWDPPYYPPIRVHAVTQAERQHKIDRLIPGVPRTAVLLKLERKKTTGEKALTFAGARRQVIGPDLNKKFTKYTFEIFLAGSNYQSRAHKFKFDLTVSWEQMRVVQLY
jgi:hypothetical protein